jgi:hypothetical protein
MRINKYVLKTRIIQDYSDLLVINGDDQRKTITRKIRREKWAGH